MVAKEKFTLLRGADQLTTYKFNTGKAEHKFCRICGVQSFYIPRSNPDSIGISPHCIDSKTIDQLKSVEFDGVNWEQTMKEQGVPTSYDQ